ncbi:MAG: class I SAM-dependent methyltransferase [Desulfovibrionaceae bacterium]|jgi:hypothetical protein
MDSNTTRLEPVTVLRSNKDFILYARISKLFDEYEKHCIIKKDDVFFHSGYCLCCDSQVDFLIDYNYSFHLEDGSRFPNLRERVVCPLCKMNSRQRLVAGLILKNISKTSEPQSVYLMEYVTPIYDFLLKKFPMHKIIGSEYVGPQYKSGDSVGGIPHEDIECLSLATNSVDLIVSNDVFEHVFSPPRAFSECSRILKENGVMLATIPFKMHCQETIKRAEIVDGNIVNILPPIFHGNPMDPKGALVVHDFGWDLLAEIRKSGFSDVSIEVYRSVTFGHLGGGLMVFKAVK